MILMDESRGLKTVRESFYRITYKPLNGLLYLVNLSVPFNKIVKK